MATSLEHWICLRNNFDNSNATQITKEILDMPKYNLVPISIVSLDIQISKPQMTIMMKMQLKGDLLNINWQLVLGIWVIV